ncbi:ABC transporter substrate-binding protein [Oscillospiraceae bacterium CM]|nr:ABC transporter substrate-binding protein [Oscillospiraceae bacterium CM]
MKKVTAILVAALLLVSLSACSLFAPKKDNAATSTTITVKDMTDRSVTFDKPAEKIVVITPSDCEILYALGAGNTVVGRGEYCDYPAEVSSVTSVQSGSNTNIEEVIALDPDVVIMSTMAQTSDQVKSFEDAGIKVIMTDAKTIDDVYTAITLIGQVVGKNTEATALVSNMKKTFDDLKAKVQANGSANVGKSIYFEVSPLQYGLYTAGNGVYMDEIATILGLKNIFADTAGWAEVSEEQVIERNPDFIVTTAMSYDGSPNPIDEILGRKGWENISAVMNKAIYNADTNSSALMHPGPRLAEAATELYNFIYGGTDSTPTPAN